MRLQFGARPVLTSGAVSRTGFDLAEALLIVAVAASASGLFWTLLRPVGPVGRWQTPASTLAVVDPTILTRFDPFFRSAPAGSTSVTSLPLKLFGTRLDQAMGRGSAIIATADGIQNSFAVGDEIMPGVRLKSVAFDNVTIERGGASEQLFLDQSVGGATPPAAGSGALGFAPPPAGSAGGARPVLNAQSLANGVSFAPRLDKGVVSGFTVAPKGAGDVFAATGLQQGDVVTQINGSPVRSAEDAAGAISNVPSSGIMSFTVERGGKPIVVTSSPSR